MKDIALCMRDKEVGHNFNVRHNFIITLKLMYFFCIFFLKNIEKEVYFEPKWSICHILGECGFAPDHRIKI
jgi:hypothetical protein